MLGKLIKHEYQATYKLFSAIYIGILAMTMITILTIRLDVFDNFLLSSIRTIFCIGFVIAVIAIPIVTIIYIAYRFYKNLFTDEGYLTFTLPASRRDVVLSKYIVSITWVVGSICILCLTLFLFYLGNSTLHEYNNIFRALLKEMATGLFSDSAGIVVSFIFYMAADVLYAVSFIYLALAFGQMIIPKHKILGAVLAYFAIQIVQQIISSIILVLYMAFTDFNLNSTKLPGSYFLVFGILLLGITALWLFLTTFICKKKLNLS